MAYAKKIRNALILTAAFLSVCGLSAAFEDGFNSAGKTEGRNVDVYRAAESDAGSLVQRLNVRSSDIILSGNPSAVKISREDELVKMLDALFMQVSDILDMHLYSLKINIKVCKNEEELRTLYKGMFNAELGGRLSFYEYSSNTIYVSAESFTREIVGHEMAHAIISHYFVIPPSIKIQEVLSMYAEYNLRRKEAQ